MGQAALDLPDPLQSPPEGGKTSTDELLAQLAGDEIDRLLAEVDAGMPRPSGAPFHVGPPVGPEKKVEPDPPALAPLVEPPPSVPSAVEQEVTAELDALFSAAIEKDTADAAALAEAETTRAERAGLAAAERAAPAAEASGDDAPLPLYLRPLEWLSAPLSIFPPTVRDLIGKAAIVTLLNATAILIYVLVVRRG